MSNSKRILRLGLPKGSLQEATIQKMGKAGFNIQVTNRSYSPYVDDEEMEIRLIRAQEVSRYVEHGYLDCGITGSDWIQENGSDVHEVGEFIFSKVTRQPTRWVRVSQAWAGQNYGMVLLPRVGDEVVVAFLDGDPDEPIIVGRVHNAVYTTPLHLTGAQNVSIWKSRSTPSKGDDEDRYNMVAMDDTAG